MCVFSLRICSFALLCASASRGRSGGSAGQPPAELCCQLPFLGWPPRSPAWLLRVPSRCRPSPGRCLNVFAFSGRGEGVPNHPPRAPPAAFRRGHALLAARRPGQRKPCAKTVAVHCSLLGAPVKGNPVRDPGRSLLAAKRPGQGKPGCETQRAPVRRSRGASPAASRSPFRLFVATARLRLLVAPRDGNFEANVVRLFSPRVLNKGQPTGGNERRPGLGQLNPKSNELGGHGAGRSRNAARAARGVRASHSTMEGSPTPSARFLVDTPNTRPQTFAGW